MGRAGGNQPIFSDCAGRDRQFFSCGISSLEPGAEAMTGTVFGRAQGEKWALLWQFLLVHPRENKTILPRALGAMENGGDPFCLDHLYQNADSSANPQHPEIIKNEKLLLYWDTEASKYTSYENEGA